eukprot:97222-Amorphochlora_amoeboformis.AAC.2
MSGVVVTRVSESIILVSYIHKHIMRIFETYNSSGSLFRLQGRFLKPLMENHTIRYPRQIPDTNGLIKPKTRLNQGCGAPEVVKCRHADGCAALPNGYARSVNTIRHTARTVGRAAIHVTHTRSGDS